MARRVLTSADNPFPWTWVGAYTFNTSGREGVGYLIIVFHA